jgi:TPP-dependent 2-oxoacid decarboxylase
MPIMLRIEKISIQEDPMPKTEEQTQKSTTTIGKYLLDRLHHLGVKQIFGIPGDYILRFDQLIEQHPIQFINATRENTAGYMSDAYARLTGLGVACITYGVGINIVNSISQAYVESSPVVLISGAASTEDFLRCQQLHHIINTSATNHLDATQLEIFKQITVAQAILDNPRTAAAEIDRVLDICLQLQKPVYIELPRNFVDVPIEEHSYKKQGIPKSDPEVLDEVMQEITEMLKRCKRPFIWAGHEILRLGLSQELLQFAEKFNIPLVSSLLGKTVISERHPLFVGVYQGGISRKEVVEFVNSCDAIFILGSILSDVETGFFSNKLHENTVIANMSAIQVQHHHYHRITFRDFMPRLGSLDLKISYSHKYPASKERKLSQFVPAHKKEISTARVFECIQKHLRPEHLIVADFGDSLFGSTDFILEQNSFLASAYFGTLGFGTPGAIGAQFAVPERRVIGIVGDGAFQMTSMELSTAVRYKLDPVIIVLNNHGYGTERPLIEGEYNDIQNWYYAKIPEVLGGGVGIKTTTEEEFDMALTKALSQRGTFYLIEVELGKTDYSPAMQRFLDLASKRMKTNNTSLN